MNQPRYQQYIDEIAAKIRDGELKPGTRLLTHREFAKQEHISLVTASRIYHGLIELGLVSGEIGRGTFVRDINLLPTLSIEQDVTAEMLDLNFSYPIAKEQTQLLRKSLRKLSVGGDLEGLLYYQQHTGRFHERAVIATYLVQQGIKQACAESTVLVSGAQHGLVTIVLGLFNPGDTIAVDALTYPGFKALADIYHINLVAIPILENGPNLIEFEKICHHRKIQAYFTMPTLHNPLGWVMNLASRRAVVKLARKYKFFLIEDGSYAFLHRPALPPLASLAPDITFYTTGFSKNIATGLRVGAVVAPIQYIENIERIIRITTWNTPALTTAIICDWIETGQVFKIERDKRRDARTRQVIAKQVLGELHYIAHPCSYFIWIPLPEGVRSEMVMSELNQRNIAVSSASSYCSTAVVPQALRVAISTLTYEELTLALQTVKSVVEYSIDL